jgi:hypothetical protein
MGIPNFPERFPRRIYQLTAWIGAIGILFSLVVKLQGITNREGLSFFTGLFLLSITIWSQQMKGTGLRPHPLPDRWYQITYYFIKWRWWGIAVTVVAAILMILPIVNIFLPQLLPDFVQAFFS